MNTEITDNLARRFRGVLGRRAAVAALTALVATVWLYHGLYNKLLGGEPRHLLIVQSVPGLDGAAGRAALTTIGIVEVAIAGWVILGGWSRTCATVQTALLLSMNAAELVWARPHLLWYPALVPFNLIFLAAAWTAAELRRPRAIASALPMYILQRHSIAIRARFEHSLVVAYALPREILEPLLPPGLMLDTHGDDGFVAVAMVQTTDLRPTFLPACFGQNFFLTGYRIFVKFKTPIGRTLRGLYILRSDTDRRRMVVGGNLLTHYRYRKCIASAVRSTDGRLDIEIRTPGHVADVSVSARTTDADEELPAGSPFRTIRDARRYVGPLPYTFDYEPQTNSIVAIKGVRENWSPRLVPVEVRELTFLDQPSFRGVAGRLASAFYVHDIFYRWERGVRYPLGKDRP